MGEVYRDRDTKLDRAWSGEGNASLRAARSHRAGADGPAMFAERLVGLWACCLNFLMICEIAARSSWPLRASVMPSDMPSIFGFTMTGKVMSAGVSSDVAKFQNLGVEIPWL